MSLQDEINAKSSKIFRDSYQMSIGELINLYRDNEMDIHPEFQRVFRWSDYQKTKLIESIMLNIPIPSIFVSQDDDGIWDIIDGVQRLSTIFQFVGIFKDENGKPFPALTLQKTDYLPSLAGVQWEGAVPELSFSREQQLSFKRARIDVVIIKKESDINTKYELFQRLNTGGSLLSDQEVRNCLMIMTNKDFYEFVVSLEAIASFRDSIPISDRKTDEQFRMELVIRLLVAQYMDWEDIKKYEDFSDLLDKETLSLCAMPLDYKAISEQFSGTFSLLFGVFGDSTFKRFINGKHSGPVMTSAFQAIAIGVYANLTAIVALSDSRTWLKNRVEQFYSEDVFAKNTTPGVKAIPRFKDMSLYGIDYFKP